MRGSAFRRNAKKVPRTRLEVSGEMDSPNVISKEASLARMMRMRVSVLYRGSATKQVYGEEVLGVSPGAFPRETRIGCHFVNHLH